MKTMVIKKDSTVGELIVHIEEITKIPADTINLNYHFQCLSCKTSYMRTIEECGIKNCSTIHVTLTHCLGGPIEELYSNCEECPGWYQCPFRDLLHEWNVYELVEKQENAYLILCQRFKFPNDVVKAIEGNEGKDVRLGDTLHHIYHKNPNITQEEVFEIISNGRA